MYLSQSEKEKIIEVLKEEGVRTASVFGSYARGEADEESDLDLIVEFDGKKSLMEVSRLERELSDKLGVDVDLMTEESLHPLIADRVEDEKVLMA